jgi:hypothetical protein
MIMITIIIIILEAELALCGACARVWKIWGSIPKK